MINKSLKAVCCLFALIAVATATIPNNNQAWRYVEDHNFYRERTVPHATNMPAYTWSPALATSSNAWATQCIWQHPGYTQTQVGPNTR